MTDTRWLQVKALFQATIERPPEERTAFLTAVTGDDIALRREVESLLKSDTSNADITNRLQPRAPLSFEALREMSPVTDDRSMSETRAGDPWNVGPYQVTAVLGAGGMGQVFRAHDSKLNRDVALKLLPDAFATDPDRLARFEREAQTLAALNHPNVGAIYGLEESSGRQALVLELVEGPTLADRIASGPLPLGDALSIARQIADALQAAHDLGIIHRDLKPANVKVTKSGAVKVLDFGLAKTTAPDFDVSDLSQSPTVVGSTRVGVVLGTAAYMSPEQARAQAVDKRTDIWAFGCVLFEMLTGQKAFAGDAASDSIAKILEREPDWNALPKATSGKVRELLRRCLQKNPSTRLRTIAEARVAIDQLLAPRGSGRTWTAVGAVAILALAVALYSWSQAGRRRLAGLSDWVQLTRLDTATQPALSPDGRMLAFIRGPNTFVSPGEIYVKVLPDGEPVQVTHDGLPKMSPVFSPDGSRIAFTVNSGGSWDTWEVSALRGEARLWQPNASGLTWISPSELLFSEVKTGQHMAIVRSSLSRTESRDLYVPAHVSGMAHHSYQSPDGAHVLVVEMDETGRWLPCRLLDADGTGRPVGPPDARCTAAAWAPDGRWMYFSVDTGDGFHVWRQKSPDGRPEQLTSGATEEEGVAISADGRSLITSVGFTQRAVWLRDTTSERQISVEGYAFWPFMSADGKKITFRVTRAAATGQSPSELWVADLESGRTERLFPGQLITTYDLSPDNRIVASVREADGQTRLWLSALDSREPPRRIPGAVSENARFGQNGEIFFRSVEGSNSFLYRTHESGGEPERMFELQANTIGTISPDGRWLSGNSGGQAFLYSTTGQPPIPLFPAQSASRLRWTMNGQRAYLSIQYGQASAYAIGRTYVLPLAKDSILPVIPAGGFRTEADIQAIPGVEVIPYGDVALGSSKDVYVFSRVTTTRNLYRIPLE